MQPQPTKSFKLFVAIGAIIAWFAVIFQLYLIIQNRVLPIPETIVQFFSYFTILSNLIVAVCFTVISVQPNANWGKFFLKPQTASAINLYIFVVGLVYNTILRWQWQPQGWQLLVDNLLHVATPIWFLCYWIVFVPKASLQYKNVWLWLIFPAVYCVYILIRGAIVNRYPYPFLDVVNLGYQQVIINCCGLVIVFLALALLEVWIGKKMK